MNYNASKALLLLFLISQIVIVNHPTVQIDISWMSTFRTLEQLRRHILPNLQKVMQTIPEMSANWIQLGRLCSPRVLFVFNGSSYDFFKANESNQDQVMKNKRKYELQLEDQLYRVLRNCRVITNICSNSLFAICNQTEFVFITSKSDRLDNYHTFYEELIDHYVTEFTQNSSNPKQMDKMFEFESKTNSNDLSLNKNHVNFFEFLWKHVDTALSKGFDDNVGKHNVGSLFQLPSLQTFINVTATLTDYFFKNEQKPIDLSKNLNEKLGKLLEVDRNFSNSFCAKISTAAFGFYKEDLPETYPLHVHERKLNQTLQLFASLARGESTYHYAQILQNECKNYWQNGRQICTARSLFGKFCSLPLHEVKDPLDFLQEKEDEIAISHCSSEKYVSTCNCGFRQTNRDDPFSVAEANWLFYQRLAQKCRCKDMQKVRFPVFAGCVDEARSVNSLLNLMMKTNLNQNDDEESDEEEDEMDDGELKTELKDVKSEFLSQEFENAEDLKSQSDQLENESQSDQSDVDQDGDDEDEEDEAEEDDEEDCEDEDDESIDMTAPLMSKDGTRVARRNRVRRMSLVAESTPIKTKTVSKESNEIQEDMSVYSTEKYLMSMRNSLSPTDILPLFSSWSLVRLGSSSVYSHNLGIQDQPGFLSGSHYLLPWNVNVKLEHCNDLPALWQGKYPPGMKNKRISAGKNSKLLQWWKY
jgi:protein SMG8